MQTVPSTRSSLVLRDLPAALRPLWPAISPKYSYTTGTPSYLPLASGIAQARALATRVQGEQALLDVAAQRAAGQLPVWQLDLAEASACLKAGQLPQAQTLLRALANEPQLSNSLQAPALGVDAELLQAHGLWLLLHVAIETDNGPQIWPLLQACGLPTRFLCEPQLGSGALLNCLQHGDLACLQLLLRDGARLVRVDAANLQRSAQNSVATVLGGNLDASQRAKLTKSLQTLQNGFLMLQLSEAAFAPLQQLQPQSVSKLRKWTQSLRQTRADAGASLPPRRSTGVQVGAGAQPWASKTNGR